MECIEMDKFICFVEDLSSDTNQTESSDHIFNQFIRNMLKTYPRANKNLNYWMPMTSYMLYDETEK